jgi:DNA replication protein DnaC
MKAAQIDVVERTTQLLAGFNLSTAAPELGPRLEHAGHRDALLLVLEVLEMEAEAREQRKITRLRRAAQIPPGKTFETLDASTLPAPLMRKLRELARGEFLERAENTLAFGLPGVGKSHAACAIGTALIEWAIQCCSVPPISWCRNCSPPSAIWRCRKNCGGSIRSSS